MTQRSRMLSFLAIVTFDCHVALGASVGGVAGLRGSLSLNVSSSSLRSTCSPTEAERTGAMV